MGQFLTQFWFILVMLSGPSCGRLTFSHLDNLPGFQKFHKRTFPGFENPFATCIPRRPLWVEIYDRLGDMGPEYVIRDIIRVATDQNDLARLVDVTSALAGFFSIVALEFAEDSEAMSGTTFVSQGWNLTSQVISIGVGVMGTTFDVYNIYQNLICLVQGNCGRYELLDLIGSAICLIADVLGYVCPGTGPWTAVLETYYVVFVVNFESFVNSFTNSTGLVKKIQ